MKMSTSKARDQTWAVAVDEQDKFKSLYCAKNLMIDVEQLDGQFQQGANVTESEGQTRIDQ